MQSLNSSNGVVQHHTIDLDTEITAQQFGRLVKFTDEERSWPNVEVCLAPVPFTDGKGFKVRPVVVIGNEGVNLVILPMTSRPPKREFEVQLSDWAEAGLFTTGTVKCSNIAQISRNRVLRRLGGLSEFDRKRVAEASSRWFTGQIRFISGT